MSEVASAYVSLIPSAKGFASGIEKELGGATASAGKKGGASAAKGFKTSFLPSLKSLAGPVAGFFAVSKAVDFFKEANAEARESQKVGALTTQVIKSTGGAAKVTAKQVGDLATALSNKTGIDDETIQSGENMLLTFKNIRNEAGKGNDVFNQSTKTLIDLSAAMGTEPKQAAIQLGKALNDPIKGITALTRVGVTFSDGQKKQIKALVASGNAMGAQKIILKELNSEFGGAAAAQATAGDKLKTTWKNFQETVGTALLPMIDKVATVLSEKVLPAVSGFIQGMQDGTGPGGQLAAVVGNLKAAFAAVAPYVVTLLTWMGKNKTVVATFAGVILTVAGAVKAWSIAQGILNAVMALNPIGLVVVAVAALAAGLVYAYKHSETFRKIVDAAFQGIAQVAKWLWDNVLSRIFKLWKLEFELIGKAGIWLWNNALQPTFKFIVKGIGWLMQTWGKMLSVLGKVPGFGWAKAAGETMKEAGQKAIDMANGIKKIPDHKATTVSAPGLKDTFNALKDYRYTLDHLPKNVKTQILTQHTDKFTRITGARAAGGPVVGGSTYLVGEKGPELFTAPTSGRITPNNQLGSATGGGIVQNIYGGALNPGQIADESARRLRFAGAV